jgi:hypothetical protein
MAEAHSAVAFSFSITHEGWDVNFDREVLHLVWQSGIRSWKKRIARFKVKRLHAQYLCPVSRMLCISFLLCVKLIRMFYLFYLEKNILTCSLRTRICRAECLLSSAM